MITKIRALLSNFMDDRTMVYLAMCPDGNKCKNNASNMVAFFDARRNKFCIRRADLHSLGMY